MLTRRSLLLAATVLAALPLLPSSGRADDAAQAAQFINQLLTTLVGIVNGGGSAADKRAALAGIVNKDVDVAGVAQFCLGRYWRTATPEQQRAYVDLFHRVLVNNITSKIGEYQGVSFEMGRAATREDAITVSTTVTRPNNQPSKVDWIVTMSGGSPKIIDVIAEGTSLRLTQRSDYAAYLSRNNNSVQALIDAMRKQADQTSS